MDFRTDAGRQRRSAGLYGSPKMQYNTKTKYRHPLADGSPVTKDEIRTFARPASEIWTNLVTAMWIIKAMEGLPQSHPSLSYLEERLRSEPSTPTSTSSIRTWSTAQETQKPVGFAELPYELRHTIYQYLAFQEEPISPILDEIEDLGKASDRSYLRTGLPALHQVFPELQEEIITMLPEFYRAITFEFDLRGKIGTALLHQWTYNRQEEALSARTIRLKHWTWWYSPNCTWQYAADETTFMVTSNGHIDISRELGQVDPHSCNCKMHQLVYQCAGLKVNSPWSLPEFMRALRQDEELLIQAVTKFVNELLHRHNDALHNLREGPKLCQLCGKRDIFFRSFDNVEWTSGGVAEGVS